MAVPLVVRLAVPAVPLPAVLLIVHSPTDEWLNPRAWEFWAMLLAIAVMAGVGYLAALQEDQDRRLRQQRRRRQHHRQTGGPLRSPQRSVKPQAVSYSPETWQPPQLSSAATPTSSKQAAHNRKSQGHTVQVSPKPRPRRLQKPQQKPPRSAINPPPSADPISRPFRTHRDSGGKARARRER